MAKNNVKINKNNFIKGDIYLKNPYTPGAGTAPQFLAGRDVLLKNTNEKLVELCNGGMAENTIFYGVRGVGKTVLLNKTEEMAANLNYLYAHIECDNNFDFIKAITINCHNFINQLSVIENIKDKVNIVKAILLSFKTTYSPSDNNVSFQFEEDALKQHTITSTGDFTTDLTDLFVELGKVTKKANKQICFFVDEIQAVNKEHLVALITALHRINQLNLPIILIGAGLPTILRVSGDAKSYSERLFAFEKVSSLKDTDAIKALVNPAKEYQVFYEEKAIESILDITGCYPYFIQQYGRIIWKIIDKKKLTEQGRFLITDKDVQNMRLEYIEKLDDSFFKVRWNRTTKAEKKFLYGMAKCEKFPCLINDIAKIMNKKPNALSLNRNNLINKGLIYSPSYGEVDFTVPQFDVFLKRINPELTLDK